MRAYLDLLREVMERGGDKSDRTGTGTRSLFGRQLRFDLGAGFPLLTTKRVHWKSVVHELLWFLRGDTNIAYLREHDVGIWNEWADEKGDLGPVYGQQWRAWGTADGGKIDQIQWLLDELARNPDSRRLVVSAWNVGELAQMALQPCHALFQFHVGPPRALNGARTLSCQLYQRSADVFLGVPFNIASYALLTHLIAQVSRLDVGDFVHTFGDVHLYSNHFEQAATQLARIPREPPRLRLDAGVSDLFAFRAEHIALDGYAPLPAIKAPVAV